MKRNNLIVKQVFKIRKLKKIARGAEDKLDAIEKELNCFNFNMLEYNDDQLEIFHKIFSIIKS